jgi:hypothetical protein
VLHLVLLHLVLLHLILLHLILLHLARLPLSHYQLRFGLLLWCLRCPRLALWECLHILAEPTVPLVCIMIIVASALRLPFLRMPLLEQPTVDQMCLVAFDVLFSQRGRAVVAPSALLLEVVAILIFCEMVVESERLRRARHRDLKMLWSRILVAGERSLWLEAGTLDQACKRIHGSSRSRHPKKGPPEYPIEALWSGFPRHIHPIHPKQKFTNSGDVLWILVLRTKRM